MVSSDENGDEVVDGSRTAGRTRRSGRVKNKPKYTEDPVDDAAGRIDGDEEEEEDVVVGSDDGGKEKKRRVDGSKTGRRRRTDSDEEEDAYELSEDEESDVSEEYEDSSGSPSTFSGSEPEDDDNDADEEEWDRRRRRFVSVQHSPQYHYHRRGSDLPPFLAEAVSKTAATRPMPFSQGAPRPSSLTPEQIQEIAKNTVSTLASVNPLTGRKLPILLPKAPVPQETEQQIKTAVSQELKQSIASLLMDPATREAMIRGLQGASAVASSHRQHQLLQQQAAGGPDDEEHPLHPRPITQLAPRKIVKSTAVSREADSESLAASRPRRAAANKKIDYSSYFKEEDEEDGRRHRQDDGRDSEDLASGESEDEDDRVGVEKILSCKRERRGKELFFVKYWGLSYWHCEWVEREELEQEKRMGMRLKKFLSKPLDQHHFDPQNIFNPDFTKIERIVYGWSHEDEDRPGQQSRSFLVKWCSLPYEDATWEKEDFVMENIPEGPAHIAEYRKRPNVDDKRYGALPVGRRPDPSAWKPFEQSPEYKAGHTLRPYQLEGVNWLVYCWMNKQSCIIADEMGLGKTVQSVAFLDLLYQKFAVRGPFLIVCPLSTLPHWQREFDAWTDLNVIVYHGSKASRDVMWEYEFFFKNAQDQPISGFTKFDVLITTYEMAMAGIEQLLPITWRIGVFDEAHRLKNRASKAADILKGLEVEHKILLSGTPIQNSILELWSLLNFLQPQRFFSEDDFMEEFGDLGSAEDVERLQELLKPLMLRRLKEDVEKSIPVKEETIIEVELTPIQKRYYRAILEKNFAFLTQGCSASNAPNLLNAMMELRKCCIHPFLIKGAEERILEELGVATAGHGGVAPDAVHQAMVQASGKLVLVDKLLRRLREGGHRVLVFSQMTKCLDILGDYLKWRSYPFERIDGAIKGTERQAAIDRFCNLSSDSFVFLLCTRAGGVGINLTAADTVVIFDSDWNPQNDLQAQARCHRIGQTRAVKIYRLITRNTYERDMFDRAGMKLGLDRAVLQKMVGTAADSDSGTLTAGIGSQLSRKEVEVLLKKGAYGVLMDTTDDAANKFCEEDIDQILERRTTVIRHDTDLESPNAAGSSSINKKSIFSKASFTATTADDFDIDIDDPNFWELWAKKLEMNPRALLAASAAGSGAAIMDEPRMKRLIRRLKAVGCDLVEPKWRPEHTIDVPDTLLRKDRGRERQSQTDWTAAEALLLQQQLALHGIGRFSDLTDLFPARTKNDIIAASKAFIKASIEAAAADAAEDDAFRDDKFKEDSEKAILWKIDFDKPAPPGKARKGRKVAATEPATTSIASNSTGGDNNGEDLSEFNKTEIPFPGASARQCHEFKSFLALLSTDSQSLLQAGDCRKLILRVQVMEMVRQIVERHANSLKAIPVPTTITGAPMPDWWGRDADIDLLVGTFRHGYGATEQLRKDPHLIYSTMSFHKEPLLDSQQQQQQITYEWPSDAALDVRLRKLLVNMEKRAQVAAKLQQVSTSVVGERRRTPASARGGGSSATTAAISSLPETPVKRIGGRKRRQTGKKAGKIVSDSEDDESTDEDTATRPGRRQREAKRGRKSAADTIAEVRRQALAKWTSKERNEFHRILCLNGLPPVVAAGRPDPESMRDEDDDDEDDVVGGSSSSSIFFKGEKRDWSQFRSAGEFGGDKTNARFNEWCQEYLQMIEAACGQNSPADHDSAKQQHRLQPDKAKKAAHAIELFRRLRSVLPAASPDVDATIKQSLSKARRSSGLPKWWQCDLHDVPFLHGVSVHGLADPSRIVLDSALPFAAIHSQAKADPSISTSAASTRRSTRAASENTSSSGKNAAAVVGWPNESIAIRRVEYLLDLIEGGDSMATDDDQHKEGSKKETKTKTNNGSRNRNKTKKDELEGEDEYGSDTDRDYKKGPAKGPAADASSTHGSDIDGTNASGGDHTADGNGGSIDSAASNSDGDDGME